MERIKKASFTVEATVVVTLFIFLVVAVLRLAFDLHKEIKEEREQDRLEGWSGVESFYRYEILEEVWEDESGDSL